MGRVGWRANVGSTQLLLDTYTGATVAYSLSKLKSTYSGSAIRVRRSIDNSEKDISFDSSGNLDTNALLDFVGYPNQFLLGSEALSTNLAFTATALTVTGNWLTGPDGVTPGNKLTETTAFNYHNTGYSIMSGNNATFGTNNFSGYLKKGTGSAAPDRIAVGVGNGTYYMYAIFNLSTGTIETQNYSGTVTNYSAKMTSAGNGWYRCSVGGVLNFPGTQSIRISFQFVNNSASYNPFTSTGYVGNVNADVQVTQVMWIKETGLQRYGKTLNSGGGTQGGGFVTTWYDQSGNSRNLTQTTSANQPQIVSSGSLITRNGKAVISASSTQWLSLASIINGTSARSWWFSYEKNTSGNQQILGLSGINYMYLDYGTTQYVGNSDFVTISPALSINTFRLMNCIYTTATYKMFANGGQIGTNTGGTTTGAIQHVPYNNFRTSTVFFNEFIYWPTDQTANRTAIENDIKTRNLIY